MSARSIWHSTRPGPRSASNIVKFRGEKEKHTPVNVGDIIVFAKLSTELKAGSSPLRIARVRSLDLKRGQMVEFEPSHSSTRPSQARTAR